MEVLLTGIAEAEWMIDPLAQVNLKRKIVCPQAAKRMRMHGSSFQSQEKHKEFALRAIRVVQHRSSHITLQDQIYAATNDLQYATNP